LRLTDIFDFASSFRTLPHQFEVFRGSLFKGMIYQRDLHEFLLNPKKRIELVRFIHQGWQGWTYNFVEEDRSLKGLRIDWATRTIASPADLKPEQRQVIENVLLRPVAPQTGRLARYRRKWFGRIIDRYRDSPTRIVFVRLARGPVPRPDNLVEKRRGVIHEFASRPNVLLCDEHAFESLEHPELYKDALHLNREGSERFSPMLVEEVRRVLGPPRSWKP
jgi:hypothetical protein